MPNFVVYYRPHTGSTALMETIACLPGVDVVANEPFDLDSAGIKRLTPPLRRVIDAVLAPGDADLAAVNADYAPIAGRTLRWRPGSARGFKCRMPRWVTPSLLHEHGAVAVVLVRRDVIRWTSSRARGLLQSAYAAGRVPEVARRVVDWPLARLVAYSWQLRFETAGQHLLARRLKRAGVPVVTVAYEDFLADPVAVGQILAMHITPGRPTDGVVRAFEAPIRLRKVNRQGSIDEMFEQSRWLRRLMPRTVRASEAFDDHLIQCGRRWRVQLASAAPWTAGSDDERLCARLQPAGGRPVQAFGLDGVGSRILQRVVPSEPGAAPPEALGRARVTVSVGAAFIEVDSQRGLRRFVDVDRAAAGVAEEVVATAHPRGELEWVLLRGRLYLDEVGGAVACICDDGEGPEPWVDAPDATVGLLIRASAVDGAMAWGMLVGRGPMADPVRVTRWKYAPGRGAGDPLGLVTALMGAIADDRLSPGQRFQAAVRLGRGAAGVTRRTS